MKLCLSAIVALSIGFPVLAQQTSPAAAAPAAVQPAGFQVVKIKLAAPQAGDPKTVNSKALVGRGTIAGREYTLVFDGEATAPRLNSLRLIPQGGAVPFECHLSSCSSQYVFYSSSQRDWPLPDQPGLVVEKLDCTNETGVFEASISVCKVLKGTCNFAGKQREVRVFDRNHNDTFGDLGRTKTNDREQRSQPEVADQAEIVGWGVPMALGKPFALDGRLWVLTVADNQIVLRQYDGGTAEIRWTGNKNSMPELSLQGKSLSSVNSLKSKDRWLVPAGDYRLRGFSYYPSSDSRSQVVCSYASTGKSDCREVKLELGKPLELGPVTEAVAKIVALPLNQNREIPFVFEMSDPRGFNVQRRPETQRDYPGFRILDAEGKEILKEKFPQKSGLVLVETKDSESSSFGVYVWEVPAKLQGTFTLEPVLAEGPLPFKLTAEKTTFEIPAASQAPGFQVVKIKLAPPQADGPKTVNSKALVGCGTIAGREYTLVFDGAKADGDLEVLRLIPQDLAGASEHKLMRAGPKAYVVPENAFFLPGRTDLVFESFDCYPERDVFYARARVVKAMKAVCDFKGTKVDVIVSDKNHNDRLGDLGSVPCDKDGYPTGISYSPNDRDLVQLADEVWIPSRELSVKLGQPFVLDDSLWTLGLVAGQVVPKAYECQTTEIRWQGDEALKPALMMVSRSIGINRLNSKGRWLLPVDEYRYVGYAYQQDGVQVHCRSEVDTEVWQEMQCLASGGKVSERERSSQQIGYKVVKLEAGKSRSLGPVKSAVARAEAVPMTPDRKITFSLKMVSPEGYSVQYYSGSWFQAKPKPGLRLLDAAGKEIYKAEFNSAFGDCTWQVPADLKGSFSAEPILTEGKPPFKVTVEKTAFTL